MPWLFHSFGEFCKHSWQWDCCEEAGFRYFLVIVACLVWLVGCATDWLNFPGVMLFPFGPDQGDTSLPPEDDYSYGPIAFPILFYGNKETTLFVSDTVLINLPVCSFIYWTSYSFLFKVNTNGLLSFGAGNRAFTPQSFPIEVGPLIAPFWDDVDIRGSGSIYFRQSSDLSMIQMVLSRLRSINVAQDFTPTALFIATWDHVAEFGGPSNVSWLLLHV